MLKRKTLTIAAITIAVIAGGVVWYQHKPAQAMAFPNASVVAVTVKTENVPITATAVGFLWAPENVMLKAAQAGAITAIDFKPGQAVQKGQLLLTINDVTQKAALQNAEAALADSKSNYQRYQSLLGQHAISQSEFDQYSATYRQNEANVRAAQEALTETRVVAPFTGVAGAPQWIAGASDASGNVLSNNTPIGLGSYVQVGDNLLQVVNTEQLWVKYTLPESLLGQAQVGQNVTVTTPAYAEPIMGQVRYISPSVNEQTGVVTLYADLAAVPAGVRPGMFVQVVQTLVPEHSVLAVPASSVAADVSGYFVYEIQHNTLTKVEVTLGERADNWVAITSGLKAGAQIVRDNLASLQEGATVQVVAS